MQNPDEIFRQMISQATGGEKPQQLRKLEEIINAMDNAIMRLSQSLQMMGQGLDTIHLKIFMLIDILVDKGIVSPEELNGHYKDKMNERIEHMRQIQEAKMEEAIKETQQQCGVHSRNQDTCCGTCNTEEEEEEVNSDVVLPSEQHKVVKF